MKILDVIRTASANAFRSKLRTSLTIIAIFIGAFTLTLTNGLGSGISTYIDKQVSNLGAEDILIIQSANNEGGSQPDNGPKEYDSSKKVSATAFGTTMTVLTKEDISKIEKIEDIKSVEPNLIVAPDYIEGANGKKYQTSANPYISGTNIDLASGSQLTNDTSERQTLLPVDFISPLGFKDQNDAIGKNVTYGVTDGLGRQHTVTAVVKGVQQKSLTNEGGININSALTNAMYENQNIGLPTATTNGYQVLIGRFDKNLSDSQVSDLKQRLKDAGYRAQTVEDQIGSFKAVINGIIWVLNAFAIIALLAAGFGIINTLLMSVQERTKEIGLMKAMGMGAGKIFLLFSTEAVMLGFWGSLLGVIVAELVGKVVNSIVSKGILKDLPGLTLLNFPIPSVAIIIGVVMVLAFFAGTLPAFRAARQNPIDSLRYE